MIPRPERITFTAAACALMLLPSSANACPLCFISSPNYRGLVIGVLFLLPLPFIIMGLIAWRLHRAQAQESHAARND